MRAVQMVAWGSGPVLRSVADPKPTGTELMLAVGASGLCRSDLNVFSITDGFFDFPLPMTLGHEVAGTVSAVGPEADPSWLGRNVVVHGIWTCGECRNCTRGLGNYCIRLRPADGRLRPIGNGLGHHGGHAEFMVVPSDRVLVATGSVSLLEAAPLADAGLTAYHAIRVNKEIIDSATVALVIGVGGLGHLAVQILRALGVSTVLGVETRATARELATGLGVTSCFETVADAADAVRDLGGADLVLDFVGAASTVEPAATLLAPGGRLMMVGGAGGRLLVGKDLGLAAGWRASAPFWGTREDLAEVISLAGRGLLHVEVTPVDLDDVPAAYEDLRQGRIHGRAVVVPR